MVRYKKNPGLNRVLVTGGAGYVGAVLVPKLLEAGYKVTVLDLYMYGEDVLKECRSNPGLREVKGDIRDGEVTEDLSLEPLTDYSKFKAECEALLDKEKAPGFVTVTIRPATVCGYSPRQRLDVVVNILTNLGYHKGEISVFGGSQLRPNIHIEDMTDAYLLLLSAPDKDVDGKVFNAGYENHSVMQLAEMVQRNVGPHAKLEVRPTNDLRSYHVSSKKIKDELGFEASHSIEDAVVDLIKAFKEGKLPNSLEDPRYFNIKMMQKVNLQ